MCGITGIVDWGQNERVGTVQRMTDLIAHRGPDGQGVKQLNGACFGHRRLSIIDLSQNGDQPMSDRTKRYWVTFNGELYGFKTLRNKLIESGVKLQSESDTEILVEGIGFWGIEGLCKRINGMFAFAIWDNFEQVLYLARDRFGEKPLYYTFNEGVFRFSSFSKALYIDTKSPELNPHGIISFLNQGFCTPGVSIYKDLKTVEPGSYCIIKKNDFQSKKYWVRNYKHDINSADYWMTCVERELVNIIEDELISDVSLGALLSGGVDSSLIASIAATIDPEINFFTVKMQDKKLDESEIATNYAKVIGGNHHIIDAEPIGVEEYGKFMGQFSEPLGDSSAVAMWIVSKAARKHTAVVLTGDGGDELFAGYDSIKLAQQLGTYRSVFNNSFGKSIHNIFDGLFHKSPSSPTLRKIKTFSRLVSNSSLKAHVEHSMFPDKFSTCILDQKLQSAATLKRYIDTLYNFVDDIKVTDDLERLMYIDMSNILVADFIPKVDVASMYHGLEARAPFLHHRLAEIAFQIPLEIRRLNNQSKGLTKQILVNRVGRQAASKIITGKRGFIIPIDKWFDNEWKRVVNNLSESRLVQEGWLNRKGVMDLLKAYEKNPSVYSRLRYNLIALDMWYSTHN